VKTRCRRQAFSRSSSIALTSDDNRAVVVNRQKASVSVIRVRNTDGSDAAQLLAEIPVGREPRFVAIAPNDHVFEKMIGNVQEAKARGGSVIALTTEGDARMAAVLDRHPDVIVPLPATTPLLTPVVMTVPLQLLAYHIAVRRGCDVDQPRNLAKSVTVE